MDKSTIINRIIKEVKGEAYLEIGTQTTKNFRAIKCETKHGVDPAVDSPYNVQLTSDEFFAENKNKYDVIFIDGLHEAEQVRMDIINAINCNPKAIILHDTIPKSEEMQRVPREQRVWTGDVWRAVVGFLESNPDVDFKTYRADWGLTVIYPEGQIIQPFEVSQMTYQKFKQNEVSLLNIVD